MQIVINLIDETYYYYSKGAQHFGDKHCRNTCSECLINVSITETHNLTFSAFSTKSLVCSALSLGDFLFLYCGCGIEHPENELSQSSCGVCIKCLKLHASLAQFI